MISAFLFRVFFNSIEYYPNIEPCASKFSTACNGLRCYLPEPFEWVILNSGLIDGNEVRHILEEPENYIESRDFFSWEQYFTKLLVDYTRGTIQQYSKSYLNSYYLQERNKKRIADTLPEAFRIS